MPNGRRNHYRFFDEDNVMNEDAPSCAHSSDSEETAFNKQAFWKHDIFWCTLWSIENRRLLPSVILEPDIVSRIAAFLAPEFNGVYLFEEDMLERTTPGI